MRFRDHRTREGIGRQPREETSLVLSERHGQDLPEVYLALLTARRRDRRSLLAPTVAAHGGIIPSVDGLQPEQGHPGGHPSRRFARVGTRQLWAVREALRGAVLAAAALPQATAPVPGGLLRPIREAGLPVPGVISDAPGTPGVSLRLAVAAVSPGVPPQLCQYHAPREAAEPFWEADRHLVVEVTKELRGPREVEAPRGTQRVPAFPSRRSGGYPVRGKEERDGADAVVPGPPWVTVLALRQTAREHGTLPFDVAGLRVTEALEELGQTLDRCPRKCVHDCHLPVANQVIVAAV